jgi:small subunit ribosomal protein S17
MKVFTGKVISKKMEKTATVAVERIVVHPVYKKRVRKVKKYHVHDEFGVGVGSVVKFTASKPFSKTKRWKIISSPDVKDKKEKKNSKKTTGKVTRKSKKEVSKKG